MLRTFEGTILWSGIASLQHTIEAALPAELRHRLAAARQVFHVVAAEPLLLDIDSIDTVQPPVAGFERPEIDVQALLDRLGQSG